MLDDIYIYVYSIQYVYYCTRSIKLKTLMFQYTSGEKIVWRFMTTQKHYYNEIKQY